MDVCFTSDVEDEAAAAYATQKGLSRTRLSNAPRASGTDSREGRVVSTGITLISLRTNVFGRPWRAESGMEGYGWREGERSWRGSGD